jgi:hypothetical protein
MNDWASFGLNPGQSARKHRKWFKHVDTSRMSWHDCHIGYTLLAIPFYFTFPWFLVGLIASLNGGYACAFTVRPPGCYSGFLWWLALFASVIVFVLFTTLELTAAQQGGFGIQDIIVLAIITKLALGQLAFLFRIRREARNLIAVGAGT